MKKIVLILLVLMLQLPMNEWLSAPQEDREVMAQMAWDMFRMIVEPTCIQGSVRVLDGEDGFVYFDATCEKHFKPEPKIPEVDPGKPTG